MEVLLALMFSNRAVGVGGSYFTVFNLETTILSSEFGMGRNRSFLKTLPYK